MSKDGTDRSELSFRCESCGAGYNTLSSEERPDCCYECGARHPWRLPTEISYGVKLRAANQTKWDGYETRHEAVGEAAIKNRRNPDVEFYVSIDEVVR